MLELARRHPEDPTSFDALAWVAILGYNTTECDEAAESWPAGTARTSGSG